MLILNIFPIGNRRKVSAVLNLRLQWPYTSRQEGQLTVFLGPLAGWKPAAETRSVARVRDSESMQRAVWRKNPNTFYVAIEKKVVLWVKNATELTGNSRFRYRKDRVL